MQTFLPFSSFRSSVQRLDDLRLSKQSRDCMQILCAHTAEHSGFRNHPAAVIWRHNLRALMRYSGEVSDELERRGKICPTRPELAKRRTWFLRNALYNQLAGDPWWLGRASFHISMRRGLLGKDPEHYASFADNAGQTLLPFAKDEKYLWPKPVLPSAVRRIIIGERVNSSSRERVNSSVDPNEAFDPHHIERLESIGVPTQHAWRMNLLEPHPVSGEWDPEAGRQAAKFALLNTIFGDPETEMPAFTHVYLCGLRVSTAFGVIGGLLSQLSIFGVRFIVVPHPSGANRWWNDANARRNAKERLTSE